LCSSFELRPPLLPTSMARRTYPFQPARLAPATVVLLALLNPGSAVADSEAGDGAALPSLLWMAPILNPGGFSSEALSFATGLDSEYSAAAKSAGAAGGARLGIRQFAEQQDVAFQEGLARGTQELLRRLARAGSASSGWEVAVCHSTPDVWHQDGAFGWGRVQPCPPRATGFAIGRAMYETDRLPETWVSRLNKMDEVWVPSQFAVEQFVSSGVDPAKVVVIPEAVDTAMFDPSKHRPPASADGAPYRFLSVFKWERRKGWDVLLRAFFSEFSAEDAVMLIIKTQAFHSDADFESQVLEYVMEMGSDAKKPLARYSLVSEDLPLRDLPRLYAAADAFVLPSRGEGWGRPHVEAMSMGLPVIATNWSGSTEFMSDAYSLPLRIDGLRDVGEHGPQGHKWAEPSVDHLRWLMRWAVEHREEAKALGSRAREAMVQSYAPEVIVRNFVLPRLRLIRGRLPARGRRRKRGHGGEL